MTAATSREPGRREWLWVVAPLALFLAVHLALRLVLSPSVEADDAELILYSQSLAWGYSEQPPLYAWLVWAAFQFGGPSVLALTLVRCLILAAVYGLLLLNARLLLPDRRLAPLAAGSVLLIPLFAWHAVSYLTHTNLLVAGVLATLYAFLRLVRDGRVGDYLLFGLAVGLGALTKYNFAWVFAALVAAGLAVGPARRRLLDLRILLAVAVAAVVVLPHALWLGGHWQLVAAAMREKALAFNPLPYWPRVGKGTLGVFQTTFLVLAAFAVVALACFRRGAAPAGEHAIYHRLLGRFFVAGLAVVLLQVFALGAAKFHERWLQPFAVVVPLWYFARLAPGAVPPGRARLFAAALAVAAVGYTAARLVQVAVGGSARGMYTLQMSFDEAARELPGDATIIACDREIAGNLRLLLPHARIDWAGSWFYHPPQSAGGPTFVVWNAHYGPQAPAMLFGEPYRTALAGSVTVVRVVDVPTHPRRDPPVRMAIATLNQN